MTYVKVVVQRLIISCTEMTRKETNNNGFIFPKSMSKQVCFGYFSTLLTFSTQKVDLWTYSLILLMKKQHKTTFLVISAVQKITKQYFLNEILQVLQYESHKIYVYLHNWGNVASGTMCICMQCSICVEVVIEQKDHPREINQAYTLSLSNSFHMLDLSATNQKISNQNIICICANIMLHIVNTYICNYLHMCIL